MEERMQKEHDFSKVMVFARKDPFGSYSNNNCYWRPAKTEKEATMGIEEWVPEEPLIIPMSKKDKKRRALMPKHKQRMFDIWHRMMWRAEVSKDMEWISNHLC